MLAHITRGLILVLIALWAWLCFGRGLPAWKAFAWVAGGFLVIKFLITLSGFTLAAWANRRDPVGFRLHPMRLIYGFVEESWATTRSVLELLPFRVAQAITPHASPRADRLPVLMIHGFVCNRGYWIPSAQKLADKGYVVESVTLEPAFGSIDAYADVIETALTALLVKTGKPQAVLVCHSMGGLAARAYLRAKGDAKVRHVITLGTPHDGTVIAQLGVGKNARQMERGNAWRQALAASEAPALYVNKFTTIYSRIDNIVAPARTATLPGAREIELIDVGHVAMSLAPRCVNVMVEELERVSVV